MSSIYDKSSLVLIPSGTKSGKVFSQKPVSGDGDFTFSRLTAATRVNADGNIEKETQNKLLRSNKFDTTWGKTNSSVTGGQSGYDGTNTAWKLIASGGNNDKIFQSVTQTGVVTLSAYAKAGNVNFIAFEYVGYAYFNLGTGAVGISGGIIDSKITSVGGGWYRCSISVNPSSTTNAQIYVTSANNSTNTSNGDFVYIQDAQLEQGLVARDYIETTAAAVEGGITDNVPRLDYTDSSCPSLLLEPQRTNLLQYSEYFGASYSKNNTSVTSNNAISPDGTLNASKFVENTSNSSHSIFKNVVNGSGDFTISIFVKSAERSRVLISNATTTRKATFNLLNATISGETGVSASMVSFGNDWYRCIISYNTTSVADEYFSINIIDNLNNLVYQGDGSSGVYIYGAQLEVGSYPTSYIPTYGSSVTRVGEANSVTGVSDLIGQTEGTLFFDVNISRVVGNEAIGTINSGAYANHATIQRVGSTIQFVRNSATQSGATIVTSATITAGRYKLAIAYKSGDTACFLNGAQVSTTQTQTFTNATLNAVKIGTDAIGALPISDSVKQSILFKTRLTNTELAALTTI